jgi:hypothetical protein
MTLTKSETMWSPGFKGYEETRHRDGSLWLDFAIRTLSQRASLLLEGFGAISTNGVFIKSQTRAGIRKNFVGSF